jgi:hypothetical protein
MNNKLINITYLSIIFIVLLNHLAKIYFCSHFQIIVTSHCRVKFQIAS